MNAMHDTGAVILSGGLSSRMGFPKAFLRVGEETLCRRLLRLYRECGVGRPVLVIQSALLEAPWNLEAEACAREAALAPNDRPELGRNYSIFLGLRQSGAVSACFIHNIDNPEMPAGLAGRRRRLLQPGAYVVPAFQGRGGHPVLLSAEIIGRLLSLGPENWILRDELRDFERITLPAGEPGVLLNLNTPAAWQAWLLTQNPA